MLLRATYPDEHPEVPFILEGQRYHHVEHARWAILWRELDLRFDYFPNVSVKRPVGNYDRRCADPFSKEKATCLYYSPHFYLRDLDRFVDIRRQHPCTDSQVAAIQLYAKTGVPVVMFEEMFEPTEEKLSPRAMLFRDSGSPFPYFLMFDGRVRIGPVHNNQHHVLHPRIMAAFREALKVKFPEAQKIQ